MIPILKKTDLNLIKSMVEELTPTEKTKELGVLQRELARAKIVEDEAILSTVIQLGSFFELRELTSGNKLCFTLTLPKNADLQEKKLSLISPLGVALIGFQQGAVFEWEMPGGLRRFAIERVTQP